MEQILPTTDYTEVDGRYYLNPQVGLDESNRFINNLRANQTQQNQQIAKDTYNLGTSVPSAMGGLGTNTPKSMSYFTSRYQTPQTNSTLANLRATAQATALNQALQNEQAKWQKKYNDAYRAYQKSAYDKQNAALAATKGGVNYNDNSNLAKTDLVYTAGAGYQGVMMPDGNGGTTGLELRVLPDGTVQTVDHGINYKESNIERAAGADQFSDLFTGMFNYTLPDGREVEEGGWDENVRKGSDGNYYVWNKSTNSYYPIYGESGITPGGTKWWTK